MIMSCNMFFQGLSVIPFFSQTVVSSRATYRISQPKPKKQKNSPRKKLLYFRKLNFFTLKKLNKTFKIFFAPKNVIKFPNTVSEAILDTLKKLILKKVHFQNCSHKKCIFKIASSKLHIFHLLFVRLIRKRKITQIIMNMPNYYQYI